MREINEVWRPIEGFECLYEVSNLGRVKSLDRWVVYKDGKKRLFKGQLLISVRNRDGYMRVCLHKDSLQYNKCIHRLVAEAFIPNPNNLPMVNHIDEVKTNNRVDNLEWCDAQYNAIYGTAIQRRLEKYKKKVNQYNKDGVFIKQWDSPKDAADCLGIDRFHIYHVCKGERRFAGGYIWRYA